MLARANRLTAATDFKAALRGRRASSASLLVHWRDDPDADPPRVGFVVSKAVGNAVIRNRVKRRLRHLCRERIDRLPGPGLLVVRAKSAAATASYADLGAELDHGLKRLTARRAVPVRERRAGLEEEDR